MIKNLSMAGLLGLFSGWAVASVFPGAILATGLIFGAFMIPLTIYIRKQAKLSQLFRIIFCAGLSFPIALYSTGIAYIIGGTLGAMVLGLGFLSRKLSQQIHPVATICSLGFLGGVLALPLHFFDLTSRDLLDMVDGYNLLIVFTIWQTGMALAIGYLLTKEKETISQG